MTSPRTVGILGAGTMGHALAVVHAAGGCDVRLHDADPAALGRARGLIEGALATLRAAGELDEAAATAAGARISYVADLAGAVAGVDLVVEAVVEDAAVKREVFAAVDAAADPGCIVASNTSHLDVFPLVPERRLARTLVAHWYTPPYIVDLVDVVGGARTDPAVVEAVRALYAGFGKRPVVLRRFIPGYIANRIQAAISLEVYALLDEGVAGAGEIDESIIHGLAPRLALLGHLGKADFTGLDMVRRAMANRTYAPPEPRASSPTLERLIASGRTGVMAGKGFYDYGDRSPSELFAERDRKLLALKRALRGIAGEDGR